MFKKAFSLLELTIALTLIALLTVIVTAGRNITNNANLAAIISEASRIEGAINGFYSEFRQLPGDFNNANTLWNGTNGDGDGILEWNSNEQNYFSDLAKANYLNIYNPAYTSLSSTYRTMDIFDKSNNVFYMVAGDNNAGNLTSPTLPTNSSPTRADNYIFYAKIYLNSTNYENFGASLTAKHAYQIDLKYDDGNPIAGEIISQNGYNASQNTTNYTSSVTCHNSTNYNLTIAYEACRVAFKLNSGSY